MSPEQFAYWLQGFVELTDGKAPSEAQWKSIKEHLSTMFKKVTPAVEKDVPTKSAAPAIDWEKIARDIQKQTEPQLPQPHWPLHPQPYWLSPNISQYFPGVPIC